ncbi:hypothetical protein HYU95_01975 [Candidatus Daviesbacteria bacterium]|nr:hypothetical protein [Candidatus Daviesbacteria bacterium]
MTLTQTAVLVKRGIILSVIALILGLTSFIGYKIWYAYYLASLPPVEEKPDIKFGTLPLIDFPKSSVSSSNFTYSLDTTTGGLPKVGVDPDFEKNIKVYFVTQTFATLLSPERSSDLAQKFGITTPPEILSETKYKFKILDKTLFVNLDNGNFSYNNSASVSTETSLDDDDKLIAGFKQILSNLGFLKNDLKGGRMKIIPLRISGEDLIPAQIRSEAAAAQISLWPDPINKKPVLTADFNESLINAIVFGGAGNLDNYLSLNFTYYPIETSTFATYPTKTAEVAFDDLKSGKGVIILEPDKPQVSITSVYLGYYLAENYNPYLQPVFVFEGPNFVAYVSAITEQFQSLGH